MCVVSCTHVHVSTLHLHVPVHATHCPSSQGWLSRCHRFCVYMYNVYMYYMLCMGGGVYVTGLGSFLPFFAHSMGCLLVCYTCIFMHYVFVHVILLFVPQIVYM